MENMNINELRKMYDLDGLPFDQPHKVARFNNTAINLREEWQRGDTPEQLESVPCPEEALAKILVTQTSIYELILNDEGVEAVGNLVEKELRGTNHRYLYAKNSERLANWQGRDARTVAGDFDMPTDAGPCESAKLGYGASHRDIWEDGLDYSLGENTSFPYPLRN